MSDYEKKSVNELKVIAKLKNIRGISKMSKPDLVRVLTLSNTGSSTLEKRLISDLDRAEKNLTIAQENLRSAKENLDNFKIKNKCPTQTPAFIIKVNYESKYERLITSIDEVKEVLFDSFIKINGGELEDYKFSHIKSWMKKAKISNDNEEITIDGNEFYVLPNGNGFNAYINRIS